MGCSLVVQPIDTQQLHTTTTNTHTHTEVCSGYTAAMCCCFDVLVCWCVGVLVVAVAVVANPSPAFVE